MTCFEGFLLHLDIDFCVAICGVQADVTEPPPDDVEFDAGLQQMDRGGVAEYMG